MPNIRPAVESEQAAILEMVREAQLNPFNVKWPNFLIAEEEGHMIGVGQLRPHTDGSCELASLVVAPDQRHKGVGSALMRGLLQNQPAPIYLFCENDLEAYYQRFGFHRVESRVLPKPQARMFTAGRIIKGLDRLLGKSKSYLIGMRWDG
jgi:amino-acid N-acetyltransferase